MSLRAIVSALGGDLFQNGCRANVPGPGHGPADRSVSLILSEGRVVVHSFGRANWRDVLGDLRARGLIDRDRRLAGGRAVTTSPGPGRHLRLDTARALWASGRMTGSGGLLARHLRRRNVAWRPDLEDLLEHPAAPLSVYGASRYTRPAMMARLTDPDGATTAVELTYLDPGGSQAVGLRVPRKTVGQVPAGSAVRLCPACPAMVVGEGVLTTLSAMARYARPGWALLSVGNMARWRAPPGVEDVIIAGDRGDAGEAAAFALEMRLRRGGLAATVQLPPAPWSDWNEAAAALAPEKGEEGRGGAPEQRGSAPPPVGE